MHSHLNHEEQFYQDEFPTDPGESLRALHDDYVEAQAQCTQARNLMEREGLEGLIAVFNRVENLPQTLADVKNAIQGISAELKQSNAVMAEQNSAYERVLNLMSAVKQDQEVERREVERLRIETQKIAKKISHVCSVITGRNQEERWLREAAYWYGRLVNVSSLATDFGKIACLEVAAEIKQCLAGYGVRIIDPKRGDDLNLQRHDPLYHEPAANLELGGKISRTLVAGFERRGYVVRRAKVGVFNAGNGDLARGVKNAV